MKNNLVALSIFCLAVSIIIGSWLISNGLSNKKELKTTQTTQNQLLTQSELAEYLGLSIEEVRKLGPVQYGHDIQSMLPYIKIGDTIYFSKEAVDKWLRNNEATSVQ
jgi:hypothetical protein